MREQDLPNHIAIIMDGNGRWAKQRRSQRFVGHRAGVKAVHNVVRYAIEFDIKIITLFSFSSENWQRPKEEIHYLMSLFSTVLQQEIVKLHNNNVRLRVIGDRTRLDSTLKQQIIKAENLTGNNTGLTLVIAFNYGGRWDIVQATQAIAKKVVNGELNVDAISEQTVQAHLVTSDLPEPDLFIRTSGEQRISNFLIWQLAYTEMVFVDCYWPDFDRDVFLSALKSYQQRERRYGLTGEQAQSA